MSFLDIPRGPQRMVSARQLAQNLILAAIGAWIALAGLRSLGPVPTQITLDAARVLRERESCDVLFVGPSYVVSQILPREFDRAARKRGHAVHSCVFGGTGLRGVELNVHLHELLSKGWPRLSLVVVDISLGGEPRFDTVNWFHPRTIAWHTWQGMWWMQEHYRSPGVSVDRETVIGHIKHLGANYLNLGAGLHTFSLLGVWPRLQRMAGFEVDVPVSEIEREYAQDMAAFERRKKRQARRYIGRTSPEKHAANVARLIADKHGRRRSHQERAAQWPAQLRAMVRAHGDEIMFLHAPVWRALPTRIADTPGEDPFVLLDFSDPKKYPSLYEPQNRGRSNHVSWYGAIEYSKLLAHEILTRWKPRP